MILKLQKSLEINCQAFISVDAFGNSGKKLVDFVKRLEWRIVRKENFPFSQKKVFLHFCALRRVFIVPLGEQKSDMHSIQRRREASLKRSVKKVLQFPS